MLVSNFIDQFRKYLEEVKFPILAKKKNQDKFYNLNHQSANGNLRKTENSNLLKSI